MQRTGYSKMNELKLNFDAVLFDFDGTLADTSRGIFNSIRYALKQEGIPVGDETRLNYFIGPPLYDGFSHVYGTGKEQTARLVEEYRVYYSKEGVYQADLYDGMTEALDKLRAEGLRTAVTSSKPAHFLRVLLPHFGLEDRFDAVVGPELDNEIADKSDLCKKAVSLLGVPADRRAAMVGDRRYDMAGAAKAGLTAVGVTYGFGSAEELNGAGADVLAGSPAEVCRFILG